MEDENRRWRATTIKLVRHLAGWVAIATVGGFAGAAFWMLDLLSHFRVQYTVLLGMCVLTFVLLKAFRDAAVSAIPLIINLILCYPLYGPIDDAREIGTARFTTIQFNLSAINPRLEEALQWVRDRDPDVVVLHELTPASLRRCIVGLSDYTCLAEQPRNDPFGIALFVRQSTREVTAKTAGLQPSSDPLAPCVEAELEFDHRLLSLLAFRAPPPISSMMTARRDRAITNASRWVLGQPNPSVIIGDFNATRWSNPIRRFVKDTESIDAEDGRGIAPTWPVGSPIQIAIDRTFTSPELVVVDRTIGPDLGSDHRPQEVVFAWRSNLD